MTLKESLESKGFTVIQWDGKTSYRGVRDEWVYDALPYVKYEVGGCRVTKGDYLLLKDDDVVFMIHDKDFREIERALAWGAPQED